MPYEIPIREKYRNFSGESKLKMALLQLYAYFNLRYDQLLDIYSETKKLREEKIQRQRAEIVESNIHTIETEIEFNHNGIELLRKELAVESPDMHQVDYLRDSINWNLVPPEIKKELDDLIEDAEFHWKHQASISQKPNSDFPDGPDTIFA